MKASVVLLALSALYFVGTNAHRNLNFLYADDPFWSEHCSDSGLAAANEGEKAYVLKKFEVPPSRREDFLEVAQHVKEAAEAMDTVEHCCLSKTKTDNLYYITVTVFDSWNSYCEFMRTFVAQKLKQFLIKENIKEYWTPLKPIHMLNTQ